MFVRKNIPESVIDFNPNYDLVHSAIYKPQSYNVFLIEKTGKPTDKQRDFVRVRSDIELLKKEELLFQAHPEVLADFAKRAAMTRPSDGLAELRKQVSDDDLMLLIKSRHCQTPSEIEQFFNDLSNRNISYKKCLEDIIALKAEEAKQDGDISTSEPAASDNG